MRKAEITLEYAPYIDQPPVQPKQLFQQACGSDEVTVEAWRKTWEKNVKENHKNHGPFADMSLGELFGRAHHRPVIIAGSGPSLKYNAHELKNRGDVTLISCLHNFHFMEDVAGGADYYVSLDAGDVVIEEVYEGGSRTEEEYWDLTKERTLLCYIGTSPKLLEKWQGKVLFFNCPVPDEAYMKFVDEVELFNVFVSNGGNVLGACLYIAKAFMGASSVAFLGADFCFSYENKFHPWDSKYDAKMGHVLKCWDVFGIPVKTWRSYHNFKGWFEWVSMTVPGVYFNCSEGGTLGAYQEGNLRTFIQLSLKDYLKQLNNYLEIEEQAKNSKTEIRKLFF